MVNGVTDTPHHMTYFGNFEIVRVDGCIGISCSMRSEDRTWLETTWTLPSYRINSTSFALNPSYFHMAHFSRYVVPDLLRYVCFRFCVFVSKFLYPYLLKIFAVQADVQCGARRQEYCQFVAFKRPDGKLVVIMTNDEITAGPIAGTGVGIAVTPWLAKGQGSLTLGSKTLSWKVTCGSKTVSGTLPWKSIQTVVC